MNTYSIGQASREVGVSTRTIRLWEARGVIPQAERTTSRYRMFSEADLSAMRFVRQARLLGLTLGEIDRIIGVRRTGTVPCGEVRQLIDHRVAEIERTIAELERLRATLVVARSNGQVQAMDPDSNGLCVIIQSVDVPPP